MDSNNNNEVLTEEERKELANYLAGYGTPVTEEKHNIHTFLHKVATADDTTKLGFLTEEEIGMPKHPIRAFKNFALISDRIIGNEYFRDFFNAESEIVTSTSLSRRGKLIDLAVIQRRQVEDITKEKKQNKSWFKPKEDENKQLPS